MKFNALTSHLTANKSVSIVCFSWLFKNLYNTDIFIDTYKLTTNCLTKQYSHFTNWMQRFSRLIEKHKMYTTTTGNNNNIIIIHTVYISERISVRTLYTETGPTKQWKCYGYRSMICGFQCKCGLQLHIH